MGEVVRLRLLLPITRHCCGRLSSLLRLTAVRGGDLIRELALICASRPYVAAPIIIIILGGFVVVRLVRFASPNGLDGPRSVTFSRIFEAQQFLVLGLVSFVIFAAFLPFFHRSYSNIFRACEVLQLFTHITCNCNSLGRFLGHSFRLTR